MMLDNLPPRKLRRAEGDERTGGFNPVDPETTSLEKGQTTILDDD